MKKSRIRKLCRIMRDENIDYVFLSPGSNFYYLTGIDLFADERFRVMIIDNNGKIVLVIPKLDKAEVEKSNFLDQKENSKAKYWSDTENPQRILKSVISSQSRKVAVEGKIEYKSFAKMKPLLKESEIILADEVMNRLRVTKEEKEISYLKKAAEIADRVGESIQDFIAAGVSEKELSHEIEYRLKSYGDGKLAFSPVVAAGPNSSSPHNLPGDYKIKTGDAITPDFGCLYNNYCSDISRTYFLEHVEQQKAEIYEIVREAQKRAIEKIQPGVEVEKVDLAARNFIEDKGYGDYFLHRTGHGVGLDYHEEPYVKKGNKRKLEPGMVFSVEPGIYLPEKFGVRIEDIVVVRENGAEVLNKLSKDLVVI